MRINQYSYIMAEQYYITPQKLHLNKKLQYDCDFAFICFCPFPGIFKKYEIKVSDKNQSRYFVHSHPSNVTFCENNSYKFIVISEVYGGPVSVSIVEELYFYGIRKVIGIGFVGSMSHPIGTNIIAEKSLIEKGTTPHYLNDLNIKFVFRTNDLLDLLPNITPVTVWTTNGFYRERKCDVQEAIDLGCEVVNMDTSHLYASASSLGMNVTYYATVTDMLEDEWKNSLNDVLENESSESIITSQQQKLIDFLISVNTKPQISIYQKRLKDLLDDYNVCKSHGYSHAEEVFKNAMNALNSCTNNLDLKTIETILLAALLHDADDKKFFPKNLNNDNVRKILFDKHEEFTRRVIEMINLVSCSVNGNSLVEESWKLIPRYSDRLEAIGLNGINRCYEYTLTIKNPFITPLTPKPKTLEELWNIATESRHNSYKGASISMIDHFYDKLLRLSNFPKINQWISDKALENTDIMAKFVLDFCNRENVGDYEDDRQFILRFLCDSEKKN